MTTSADLPATYTLPMSQEALEALPFPLSLYTCEGVYVGANGLVEQLFRVPRAALVGAFNLLTDPRSEGNGARESFQAAVDGQIGRAPRIYYDFSFPETQTPDREGCWIEMTYLPFRDTTGSVTHVGTMIQDVTERVEVERQQQQLRIFEALFEHAPDAISVSGVDGRITYANVAQRLLYGYGDDTIGMDWRLLYPPDVKAQLDIMGQEMYEQGFWRGNLEQQDKNGRRFPVQISAFMLRDAQGSPYAYAMIIRDLSEQQRTEQENLLLQQQVISAQQAALRELSTPLIPIADGVVAMPLIGSIDSSRAQLVMETLLGGVATLHANTTIIDITGVPVVDTQVANVLLRAAQSIKLLGARVIITGIRPEVAQTLVGLGVDLGGIVTRGTLQSGIAEALERESARR